jgi:hypothetical protein
MLISNPPVIATFSKGNVLKTLVVGFVAQSSWLADRISSMDSILFMAKDFFKFSKKRILEKLMVKKMPEYGLGIRACKIDILRYQGYKLVLQI